MITLKTLPDATAQGVFDQVARHLLTQNAKSTYATYTNSCKYRGHNGYKCAAGCLIADDEYKEEFEGLSWLSVGPVFRRPLISRLQVTHDCIDLEEWKDQLLEIAEEFDLSAEVLKEFSDDPS